MSGKHKFDVWLWLSAFFVAIGLLSAPDLVPAMKAHPGIAFVVPMVLAGICFALAVRAGMQEERVIPPRGRERRMIALVGMILCAVALCVFAGIYFWPSYSLGGGAVPPPSLKDATAKDIAASKPDLRVVMLGANVFIPDAVDLKGEVTGIALDVRIWNTGTPSVAISWSLMIIPKDGPSVNAQFSKIPEKLSVSGPIVSAVIKSSDALDEKTTSAPIGPVPVTGTLLFYVKMPQKIVKDKDTKWELSVQDIYGKSTTVLQRLGDWMQR